MSDTDPFTPPKANVDAAASDEDWPLGEPRRVPIGNSWTWIADGFRLFVKSPVFWIVNVVLYLIIISVLSFIPLISIAVYIINPIFQGGFMYSCRQLDDGDDMSVGDLFVGFSTKGAPLAAVGGLYLVGVIAIMLFVGVIAAIIYFSVGPEYFQALSETPDQIGLLVILGVLVVMALAIPLAMAIWFAPPLVMFHEIEVFDALKMSFKGCWRNILPLVVYGVILLVIVIIATIPFGLGLFVVGPVAIATMYTAYKDIFVHHEQAA